MGGTRRSSSSSSRSMTLSVDEKSMDDVDSASIDSRLSDASSTTVCWAPGGLSGKMLQVFGLSTVDLVESYMIKKRLSSISSQVNLRFQDAHDLSMDETEFFRHAYRDLVEISSGSYKAKFSNRALTLRLAVLRALIQSDRSCFETLWHKYTFRKMWRELDDLSASLEPAIQDMAWQLRSALVTKVADELSSLRTKVRAQDLSSALAGTDIVRILCEDLAYGNGGYAVQNALDRISCSSWGAKKIEILNHETDIVLGCVQRLLLDFDNVWSRGMAFRIFGNVAAAAAATTGNNARKLFQVLSGPHGVESLVNKFAVMIRPEEHLYHRTFGKQCRRSMEVMCTALLAACCHGFRDQVIQQGLCPLLIELIKAFNIRDQLIRSFIEGDECEDPDIERDQIATFKLLLKLLETDAARNAVITAGGAEPVHEFGDHPNRQCSDWYLKYLVDTIRQRLQG